MDAKAIDQIKREDLESLAMHLLEQEQAYDENKLDLYKPHKGQQEFHESNKKIRAIITGNRWGKTTASVMEAVKISLGIHPTKRIPIPNRGKMYAESYSSIMETIYMKIEEWVPKKFLDSRKPFNKNQFGQITRINFYNGSFIQLGTYDQQESKSESSNWHYVGFDEPPPRALYVANLRGCVDFGGLMWFSMTPLKEAWIHDDIYEPGLKGTKPYIQIFQGNSHDNPYLPRESLDLFVSELTEDEKEVRIAGKFCRLLGTVIDTYDPFVSDIDPFPLDDKYVIYEGIDPHPRKANSALWKAIDADGFRFVVAELSCDSGIFEFGKQIAAMRRALSKDGASVIQSVADNSLNQKDMMFKINQRDELCRALRAEGESLLPAMAQKRDWIGPGIQKLRDLYRSVYHPKLDKKLPMEYLFESCVPRYKWELTHYQWPKEPLDQAKPVAKHNEFIDCNRYIESLAPYYETPGKSSIIRRNVGAYGRLDAGDRADAAFRFYRQDSIKKI